MIREHFVYVLPSRPKNQEAFRSRMPDIERRERQAECKIIVVTKEKEMRLAEAVS